MGGDGAGIGPCSHRLVAFQALEYSFGHRRFTHSPPNAPDSLVLIVAFSTWFQVQQRVHDAGFFVDVDDSGRKLNKKVISCN